MFKYLKTVLSAMLVICMVCECIICVNSQNVSGGIDADSFSHKQNNKNTNSNSYSDYLRLNSSGENVKNNVCLSIDDFSREKSISVSEKEIDGKKAVCIPENGQITFDFYIEETGLYNIYTEYFPVDDGTSSIKTELLIDGSIPFREAQSLSFKRIWRDNSVMDYDAQGNQIRLPSQVEPEWSSFMLQDSAGLSDEALKFFFSQGNHSMTFCVYQNTLALGAITLSVPQGIISYKDVQEEYQKLGYKPADKTKQIEAENALAKSDRSIVMVSDKTSPDTKPASCTTIKYNTIGAGTWKTVGEWVEWMIDVPETGLYAIATRFKQDLKSNGVSFRTLYIDGEIPFKEAKSIAFNYSSRWQSKYFGNGETNYYFYLTKGKHRIKLVATLGEYSGVISEMSDVLSELNGIYTDIVMVTGPEPDVDRDYQFEKIIPDVIGDFTSVSKRLKNIEKKLEKLTGEKGGQNTAVIVRLYNQLDRMYKNPESISKRLKNFINDITSLGTWVNTSREQPLQLDYLMLSGKSDNISKAASGVFSILKYYTMQFAYSFAMDYANVGNKSSGVEDEIRAWIGSGRDQADIIRQLTNETFTPQSNIGVNIQLVNAGALLPATLAHVGPDVYLGIAENLPVDYALRNAVVDLSQFNDIEDVTERLYKASFESFYLDHKLYALPETMSYPMLFYRKDILSQLNIDINDLKTWDGLLQKVLPELDMNYFDFGIPATIKTFANFLYQNGGKFYSDNNTSCAINTSQGVMAFQQMTSMFKDYGIPVSYDFANRFRSGQMPLAIAEYTCYNQLSVFAPEIEGLWGMLPVPGIVMKDGTIDNTVVCTVTGSVILSNSKKIKESWEFLKWYTGAAVQSRYAAELETVMGTGARYAAANIEAMKSVEWNRDIKQALIKQQDSIIGMPYIAGSYYTNRGFDFAFRDVVYNNKNLRETLSDANDDISKAITDKRSEFYKIGKVA